MQTQDEITTFQNRLTFTWVIMLALIGILLFPRIQQWFGAEISGDPRPITPRGKLAEFEQTTVDLFQSVSESVVYIDTKATVGNPWTLQRYEQKSGTGSGFVWDDAGHIVTNYHVIKGASSADVVFANQVRYVAKLVSFSEEHDLAVLRIDAPSSDLKPVLIGESSSLQVGQSVFAIGNPFGFEQSLTTGVVSNRSRAIKSPSGRLIEDVIQIDAAINPGNSGGPLMDSAGRLIGVNTLIYSTSGSSAGIGFAIPVDTVNQVVPDIIARKTSKPLELGISGRQDLNNALASRIGIRGIVILEVKPGSPADRAGIQGLSVDGRDIVLGDVVLEVDGERVTSFNELQAVLRSHKSGHVVKLTVLRKGREVVVDVALD
jgi:S1-C subfamily serine protease